MYTDIVLFLYDSKHHDFVSVCKMAKTRAMKIKIGKISLRGEKGNLFRGICIL